jgi:RNA polymerase sigma-70 factor (ECF subfamily)
MEIGVIFISPKTLRCVPQPAAHFSDQQLLERFRLSSDNKYAGLLLQRYTLLLFGVCMKYLKNEEEARDAVQQVCMKALHEMPKYEVTYFKSWIYTIARNHCLMQLRKTHRQVNEDNLSNLPDPAGEWMDRRRAELEKEELLELVEQGLAALQVPQKQCVTLFYLQKMSYQQIATHTGFTLLQVKSAIQNGKRNLRIWVEKHRNDHAS